MVAGSPARVKARDEEGRTLRRLIWKDDKKEGGETDSLVSGLGNRAFSGVLNGNREERE